MGVRGYTIEPAFGNQRNIWLLLSVAVLALAVVLAACGADDDPPAAVAAEASQTTATTDDRSSGDEDEDQPSNEVQEEVEEQEQALPDFPLTLTDDSGLELTIPAAPLRVVAILPSVVDLVADLGLADRLVGVDDFSLDDAPNAVSVGGNNFTFNIEAVAELQPDLILIAIGGTEDFAQQARELNFPVYAMGFPDSLQAVFQQLRLIGRMLGEEQRGAALAAELEDRFLAITQRAAAESQSLEPIRVYLEVDQSTPTQPFSIGPGSLHQEIIELAGGVNVFASAQGSFPQVNWESIIDADPQLILLLNSKELADELSFNPISAAEVAQRIGWGEISAVQDGLVTPLPGDLFSVGARLVDALERVAEAIADARALTAQDDAA
ncbi:MAG: iron complex transport system substrate-binding protein [Chloroflexi bacterium]|nr:MAG: iron complex transport system substrate-binding protein [Chloroflexota bacterium]